MLYLIGIGLNPRQLTLEALDALKQCSEIYLDSYTSKFAEGSINELEELTEKPVTELKRSELEEDEKGILSKSRTQNIALLVYGNMFFATTHIQLLIDAKQKGTEVKCIPGISIQNYLGKTGLDEYRFGRITSVVFPKQNYSPESFYDAIKKNYESGLHTLCLLDIDMESNALMSIQQALKILKSIESKRKESFLDDKTFILIAAAGSEKELIRAGEFSKMSRSGFGGFPQAMIICGKLTEKEKEALAFL
ncbi:MAG: diphthine synthase [Candidatus Diapherotrites archaeon]